MRHTSAFKEPMGRILPVLHGQLSISPLLILYQSLQQKQWTLKGCPVRRGQFWLSWITEDRAQTRREAKGGEEVRVRWASGTTILALWRELLPFSCEYSAVYWGMKGKRRGQGNHYWRSGLVWWWGGELCSQWTAWAHFLSSVIFLLCEPGHIS